MWAADDPSDEEEIGFGGLGLRGFGGRRGEEEEEEAGGGGRSSKTGNSGG